jgi:anti-repressor protein
MPSIRKHGAYLTEKTREEFLRDPSTLLRVVQSWKNEEDRRKIAESRVVSLSKKIEVDAPKVIFAGKVMAADETRTIGELSKFLGNHSKIKFGQNKLHRWMREKGYTMRTKNGIEPTQKSLNLGILVATIHVLRPGFNVTVSSVTWKGVLYFMKKFHDLEKNGVWSLGE